MINSKPLLGHWIDGREVTTGNGTRAAVHNPALGEHTKDLTLATTDEIEAAIASAQAAFRPWRDLSISRRQAILFRFRDLLAGRKDELAELITAEHGKTHSDAVGEIARGLEVVELACGFPHFVKGAFSENVSTGVDVYSIKQPLGVVGVISPFNFPAMVPLWFFPIAIAAGNTVVLKPSEKVPSAALWIARLWKEAGLPDGVFNVLQGDKAAVDGILRSDGVRAVSFVGSTPVAQYIYEQAAKYGKRVQALGGANNHMVVLPDADLDFAATQAINAGYGSAGERCMAQSVIVAVGGVADELIPRIKEQLSALTIGIGSEDPDMGPLITADHRSRVVSYIQAAEDDGADILVDGRGFTVEGAEDGFWLAPTLIDNIPLTSKAYQEEIFGPVLAVVRLDTLDEAIALINSGRFGNGTAIFTSSGGAARTFQSEVEVGMVGVNVPIPVPVAYHSFGGFKDSLFGGVKAYGVQGFEFFTQEKAVTSRWPGVTHRGDINLGFPGSE